MTARYWKFAVISAMISGAGVATWKGVLAPWRRDRRWVAAATAGLRTLAELEQAHCFYSGRYTDNLLSLASMSPAPRATLNMTESAFVPGSLRIAVSRDSVILSAMALDRRGRTIALQARRPQDG